MVLVLVLALALALYIINLHDICVAQFSPGPNFIHTTNQVQYESGPSTNLPQIVL